ncbi:MAG: universal stress protein [Cyanobacteria bacterium CRU_2_1]|nr:universal stress protein [Cyanobacteria bacterium RU_5_0]NJR58377.1 universal stress protein [Cyanobacteria bacterium CRU_2_1]
MGFKKILAAIDYSSLSQSVFEQALELAKSNRATLKLFHSLTADMVALSPPFTGEFGLPQSAISQTYQADFIRLEQQIQYIQTALNHFCQIANREGIVAEYGYEMIEAGQGICQAAHRWNADLIVLGRRGRTGLAEVLLGSVSNYVMHHAACAVLVIQANAVSEKTSVPM